MLTVYADVHQFLQHNQARLEQEESANNLMLGICLRLRRFPERIQTPPLFFSVSEQGGELVAIQTPPHNLIVHAQGEAAPALAAALAAHLHAHGHNLPGVLGPNAAAGAFAAAWKAAHGCDVVTGMRQRIYELRQVIPPPQPPPGSMRPAQMSDSDLLAAWTAAFQAEALGDESRAGLVEATHNRIHDGDLFVWQDGGPVSCALKSRPTPHGATVGMVYTPPELRGRGYASACVAALSQLILDSGKQFCNLFTDLSNPVSNSIYQKVGYRAVCDYLEYHFV